MSYENMTRKEILEDLVVLEKRNQELQEQLREARAQSRVNNQHRLLYQDQRDRARRRLEAIEEMALDCLKRNVKVAPQSIMMALRSSGLS